MRHSIALRAAALAALASVLAPSEASAGSHGCPPSRHGAVPVELTILDGGVQYDFSRGTPEIAALARTHGVHAHGSRSAVVRGLTATTFQSAFSISLSYMQVPGGVCVRPVNVKLNLGYGPTTVYVQRDYLDGSCQRARILEHEEGHVRINREVFAQHLPHLNAVVAQAVNHSAYPVWASDIDSGSAVISAALQGAMQIPLQVLQERRNQMHAALDSPQSYQATQNACPSW